MKKIQQDFVKMSKEYKIIDMINNDEGVLISRLMDDDFKKEVLKYEMKRLDELVPFINKGMEEALNKKEAMVIIKRHSNDNDKKLRDDDGSFTLRTENGEIIGESIYDEDELEELRNDPTVYFLSENFVTYNNIATPGQKQFFVMEGKKSDFVTKQDIDSCVDSLVVAVPSTETDHYIKDYYDIPHDEHIGTIIIGFTPLGD